MPKCFLRRGNPIEAVAGNGKRRKARTMKNPKRVTITTKLSRREFLKVGVTYNAQWWDNNREAVTERFDERAG